MTDHELLSELNKQCDDRAYWINRNVETRVYVNGQENRDTGIVTIAYGTTGMLLERAYYADVKQAISELKWRNELDKEREAEWQKNK